MRRLLVAGNWKMNASRAMVSELLGQLATLSATDRDVLVCPPFPYLVPAAAELAGSGILMGAQNCAAEAFGAFTGEVSAAMLADVNCQYVILGHSERRSLYGETDELVLTKMRQVLDQGLKVILCVGESLQERQAGQEESVVGGQLALALAKLGDDDWKQMVVAYEPVWAIGTGETATPAQAQAMHAFIRAQLAARAEWIAAETRVLYGGSVKADNAAELFSQPDIDGGLVGGASLDVGQFTAICMA
ncbi:triose-phosphate isomerase [Parathalassolituus penaei]|uniref:triose-phosphate isomerase n=1 Tax=Parathalassolituus penaei TaxID=2997323 RepID=UPI003204673C